MQRCLIFVAGLAAGYCIGTGAFEKTYKKLSLSLGDVSGTDKLTTMTNKLSAITTLCVERVKDVTRHRDL
ncbi:MAG: hypothetical protein M0008_12255 [Actinomycetota bacterium]|jgi:hypothetical protein|nr:hypothetical protein [Actinomycetota bacterium]